MNRMCFVTDPAAFGVRENYSLQMESNKLIGELNNILLKP